MKVRMGKTERITARTAAVFIVLLGTVALLFAVSMSLFAADHKDAIEKLLKENGKEKAAELLLARRKELLEGLQNESLVAAVRKLQLLALELHDKRQAALAFISDTEKFTEKEGQAQAAKLTEELKNPYNANFTIPMLSPEKARALDQLLECDKNLTQLGKRPAEDHDPYYKALLLMKEAPLSVQNFPLDDDAFQLAAYNKMVLAKNQSTKAALSDNERKAIKSTNEHRTLMGMRALLINDSLLKAAQQHSREMRDKNYYGHESPDEKFQTMPKRTAHFGYPPSGQGENIAKGQKTSEQVHASWLGSAPHHRNKLQPHYLDIGLGGADILWTEVFGAARNAADRSEFTKKYPYIPVGEGEIALLPFKDDFTLLAHRELKVNGTTVEINGKVGSNGSLDLRGNISIKGSAYCGGRANVANTVKISGKRQRLLGYHLQKPADTVVQHFKARNDNGNLPGAPTALVVAAAAEYKLPNGNYYFSKVTLGKDSKLIIQGQVRIFTDGPVDLRKGQVVNETRRAENFAIISSERSRGTVYLPQTGTFIGCVYAPGTSINIAGDKLQITGSIVGGAIQVSGQVIIAYDTHAACVGFWFLREIANKKGIVIIPDGNYPVITGFEIEPEPSEFLSVGETKSYRISALIAENGDKLVPADFPWSISCLLCGVVIKDGALAQCDELSAVGKSYKIRCTGAGETTVTVGICVFTNLLRGAPWFLTKEVPLKQILVDLDVADIADQNEDNPQKARVIVVNRDDDNYNGKPDVDENDRLEGVVNKEKPELKEDNLVEIYVRKVEPANLGGDVVLNVTKGADAIRVWKDPLKKKGTRIAFDGKDNRWAIKHVPQGGIPLYVEAVQPSEKMGDVELTLTLEGTEVSDKILLTCLWVEINESTCKFVGKMSADNAARQWYVDVIMCPSSDKLGPCQNVRGMGWAVELTGRVRPADFDMEVIMDKDATGFVCIEKPGAPIEANGDQPLPEPPPLTSGQPTKGNDLSPDTARDDDPMSGGSEGIIYDLDAPGASFDIWCIKNTIIRARYNLRSFARFSGQRCSDFFPWHVAVSYRLQGNSERFRIVDIKEDVSNDRKTLRNRGATWEDKKWDGGSARVFIYYAKDKPPLSFVSRIEKNTEDTLTLVRPLPEFPKGAYKLGVVLVAVGAYAPDPTFNESGDNKAGPGFLKNLTRTLEKVDGQ